MQFQVLVIITTVKTIMGRIKASTTEDDVLNQQLRMQLMQ